MLLLWYFMLRWAFHSWDETQWVREWNGLSWLWSCQTTKYSKTCTGSPLPRWRQLAHLNVSFLNSRNVATQTGHKEVEMPWGLTDVSNFLLSYSQLPWLTALLGIVSRHGAAYGTLKSINISAAFIGSPLSFVNIASDHRLQRRSVFMLGFWKCLLYGFNCLPYEKLKLYTFKAGQGTQWTKKKKIRVH